MAIYDIFENEKADCSEEAQKEQTRAEQVENIETLVRDRLFASITSRLFFFLLLIADVFWGVYTMLLLSLSSLTTLITFGKIPFVKRVLRKAWTSFLRSIVCGLSLVVALFSPAFGIMIACTYFLMYDKTGMEEVVPSTIQSQFKDLFKQS